MAQPNQLQTQDIATMRPWTAHSRPSAGRHNTMLRAFQALAKQGTQGGMIVDADGVHTRAMPKGQASVMRLGWAVEKRVELISGQAVEAATVRRLLSKPSTIPRVWSPGTECVEMFPTGQAWEPDVSVILYHKMQFADGAAMVGLACLRVWDWDVAGGPLYWREPDCSPGAEECGDPVPPDDVPGWATICDEIFGGGGI